MKAVQIDADLENSDWTKQSYDLPVGKELEEFLKLIGMTMADFKKLPAYYLPKQKKKKFEVLQ